MKPIGVGIVGLGTVGAGTMRVLARNHDEIARRAGREIRVVAAAVNDLGKSRDCEIGDVHLSTSTADVVNHPDVDVVVELIGGEDIAREVVLNAISAGKHVVTANKALIAVHGNEIFDAASRQGVTVAFEAAVAGGISIIKAIREGLAGNRIEWLAGIINGTSNFILTAMHDDAGSFDEVLAQAQELGYAESDPTFDVEGMDAAHKLTILASIAFGIPLQYDAVYIEGVSKLRLDDIKYAGELGYRIKHLGIAARNNDGIELRVHPTLLPERSPLANIDGVMNAILVYGDAVGLTMHSGAGAGAEPTASAVVADLVDVVRTLTTDPDNRVPHLAFQPDSMSRLAVLPIGDVKSGYYVRMNAVNQPGVLAEVTRIFGDLSISIESVLQKGSDQAEAVVPIILMTQPSKEQHIDEAIAQLQRQENVVGDIVRLRVGHPRA